jgi:hypothetical protein
MHAVQHNTDGWIASLMVPSEQTVVDANAFLSASGIIDHQYCTVQNPHSLARMIATSGNIPHARITTHPHLR